MIATEFGLIGMVSSLAWKMVGGKLAPSHWGSRLAPLLATDNQRRVGLNKEIEPSQYGIPTEKEYL